MEREDPWAEGDGEELEAEIMRADRPFAADRHGTTAEEASEGLGIDEAVARERREGRATDETFEVVDEGIGDVEAELIGEGAEVMDAYPSPEEAALSVRDEAPGATDHEDPHPADEG